jgi:hypothetical protein
MAALDSLSPPVAAIDMAAHALYAKALHDLARDAGMERVLAAMQADRGTDGGAGALRIRAVDLAGQYRERVRDGIAGLARSRFEEPARSVQVLREPGEFASVLERTLTANRELGNKLRDFLETGWHRPLPASQLRNAAAILMEPAPPLPSNAAERAYCLEVACLRALHFESEMRHLGLRVQGAVAQKCNALADAAGGLHQQLVQAWFQISYPELADPLPSASISPLAIPAPGSVAMPPGLEAVADSLAAASADLEAFAERAVRIPAAEFATVRHAAGVTADGSGWTLAKAQRHAMVYYRTERAVEVRSLVDQRLHVRVLEVAGRPGGVELTLSSDWRFSVDETAQLLSGLFQAYELRPSSIFWSSGMDELPLGASADATVSAAIGSKLGESLGANRVEHLLARPIDSEPTLAFPVTKLGFVDAGKVDLGAGADALILPPSDAVQLDAFARIAGSEGSFTAVVRTTPDGRMLHPDGHPMDPEEASFYFLDCPAYQLGRPVTLITEHGAALAAAWAALLRVPVAAATASAFGHVGPSGGGSRPPMAAAERRKPSPTDASAPARLLYAVGRGDEKILYADSKGRVTGIARPGRPFEAALARLHHERQLTARLGRRGVPVVDIEEIGSVLGRPSIVYGKEYPANTEAIRINDMQAIAARIRVGGLSAMRYGFTRTDLFSERTLEFIARIRQGMDVGIAGDDEPVDISDFEAMIDDDGALYVNDPIGLGRSNGRGRRHIMLLSLEEATLAKLGTA